MSKQLQYTLMLPVYGDAGGRGGRPRTCREGIGHPIWMRRINGDGKDEQSLLRNKLVEVVVLKLGGTLESRGDFQKLCPRHVI